MPGPSNREQAAGTQASGEVAREVPDDDPVDAAAISPSTEADPADVLEQHRAVGPVAPPPSRRDWMDADEADALEQSMEVPLDDDTDRP
ncbi:MAG TPA: hypothetical protein VMU14_22630 [Acidimicrobiales bacterium]|nr:hypothetical protein [Acidimicrobiales bacterium]